MGFVALKPLISVLPGTLPDGPVAAFSDDRTEAVRLPGSLSILGAGWAIDVRTAEDGEVWEHVLVRITADIEARDIERLNRLLKGTGFPKVETDWRTKKPALLAPGRRHALPVRMLGALTGEGTLRASTLDIGPFTTPVVSAPPVVAPPVLKAPVITEDTPPVTSTPAASTPVVKAPWDRKVSPTRPTPAPEAGPAPEPLRAERLEPIPADDIWTYPTTGSGIVTAPGTMDDLDIVWAMHTAGKKQVVALVGPAGTGKTSLAYDLAAKHGVPYYKVDAAGAVTFADWVGFQSATERNGATVTEWSPSGFVQAIRADGPKGGVPRIVVVDEVNRAESSGALNALLACTDHTGSLYIPDALRTIPIDPAVLIMYTANVGAGHTGTVSMDVALKSRVTHWVEMLYPAEDVEVALVVDRTGISDMDARRLVRAATQVRAVAARGEVEAGIGTRDVLQAADKVAAGFSLVRAARSTWLLAYAPDDRGPIESLIDALR